MHEPMIGHNVFFQLHDNTPAARQLLLHACKKYLTGHPGEVSFAVGIRGEAFVRSVNDHEWDVALHIVFQTKADHDRYQDAKLHDLFIAENQANWRRVRVFDSLI
jgi:hypothetical protein